MKRRLKTSGGERVIVKNVLIETCKLIGLNDMVQYLNGKNDVCDEEELSDLLVAINMAINNISANYINVCKRVSVSSVNGQIKFSKLSDKSIIQIKKVLKNNLPIKFKVHSDGIEVDNGKYEVVYSFFPDSVYLKDEIDYFPQLNELLLAYAVVAEYLFLKGQIDDAYVWDKRFKALMLSIQRPTRNITLPKRRWW